jgi:hypothetical protein
MEPSKQKSLVIDHTTLLLNVLGFKGNWFLCFKLFEISCKYSGQKVEIPCFEDKFEVIKNVFF